ncbi:MAG: sigma-70 family RNA polymerase sigma factor [Oligoflexia bacterium]|nr:sigma-70 family RNA polymerase sigma factor [Oligoflexia bacterium]
MRPTVGKSSVPESAPVREHVEPVVPADGADIEDTKVGNQFTKLDALSAKVAEYQHSRSLALRDEIVSACMPMLEICADTFLQQLARSPIFDATDLVSYGYMRLEKALLSFDPSLGIRFSTYAAHNVRGGMLDGIREMDLAARLSRGRQREIEVITEKLLVEGGVIATDDDICSALDLTPAELAEMRASLRIADTVALDTHSEGGPDEPQAIIDDFADPREISPHERVGRDEFWAFVMRGLPAQDQFIIRRYCIDGASMAEVGRELELTESRVCQRAGEIAKRLRTIIETYPNAVPLFGDTVDRLLASVHPGLEASILIHEEVSVSPSALAAAGFVAVKGSVAESSVLVPVSPSAGLQTGVAALEALPVIIGEGGEATAAGAPLRSLSAAQVSSGHLISSNQLPEGAVPGNASILPAIYIDGDPRPERPEATQLIAMERLSLHPHNPRVHLSPDSIAELVASFRQTGGIHTPLEIAKCAENGVWYILGGARRFLASQESGYTLLPCHVEPRALPSAEIFRRLLVDNEGHDKPASLDLARAYQAFIDVTQLPFAQAAKALSVKPAVMSRLLSLLALPAEVQEILRRGELSDAAGEVLARCGRGEREIRSIARDAVAGAWSLRQLKEALTVEKPTLARGASARVQASAGPGESLGATSFWIGGETAAQVGIEVKGNSKPTRAEIAAILWAAVRSAAASAPRSREITGRAATPIVAQPENGLQQLSPLREVSALLASRPNAVAELAKVFGDKVFVKRGSEWFVSAETALALGRPVDERGLKRLKIPVTSETMGLMKASDPAQTSGSPKITFVSLLVLWGSNLAALQGQDTRKFYTDQLGEFDSTRQSGVEGRVLRQDLMPRIRAAHAAFAKHLLPLAEVEIAAKKVALRGTPSAVTAHERELISIGIPLDSSLKTKFAAWQSQSSPDESLTTTADLWNVERLKAFWGHCQVQVLAAARGNADAMLGPRELVHVWLPPEFRGSGPRVAQASKILARFDQLHAQCDLIGKPSTQAVVAASQEQAGAGKDEAVLEILNPVAAPSLAIEAKSLPDGARVAAAPSLAAVYVDGHPHWEASGTIQLLDIRSVSPHPWNPRKTFSREKLEQLKAEIQTEGGLLKPILVYQASDVSIHPLSGHRRLMACTELGYSLIPCRLIPGSLDPALVLKSLIVTNEQHERPAPIDTARSYFEFMRLGGVSPQEAAARLGKNSDDFMRALSLLTLPDEVQAQVNQGAIPEPVALALARYNGTPDAVTKLATRIVSQGMTVAAVERLVDTSRPRFVADHMPDRRSEYEFSVAAPRRATVRLSTALGALDAHGVSLALQVAFSKSVQQFSAAQVQAVKLAGGGACVEPERARRVLEPTVMSLRELMAVGMRLDPGFEAFYRGWRELKIRRGATLPELAMGQFILQEVQQYFVDAAAALRTYLSTPGARADIGKPKLTEILVYSSRIAGLAHREKLRDFDIQRELDQNRRAVEAHVETLARV